MLAAFRESQQQYQQLMQGLQVRRRRGRLQGVHSEVH